jgi:hypothetical protein
MSTPEQSDAADWRAINVWVPAINRIQELTDEEFAAVAPQMEAAYWDAQAELAAHVEGRAA